MEGHENEGGYKKEENVSMTPTSVELEEWKKEIRRYIEEIKKKEANKTTAEKFVDLLEFSLLEDEFLQEQEQKPEVTNEQNRK